MKAGFSSMEALALVVLVIVGFVGYAFVAGGGKLGSVVTVSGAGGSCSTGVTGQFPKLAFGASYQDQSNNFKNTTAQTAFNLTVQGQSFAYRAGADSATALTTDQNQSCGTKVNIVLGDSTGTAYYSVAVPQVTLGQNVTTVAFTGLQKVAQLSSVKWGNSTATANSFVNVQGAGGTIIAGATSNPVSMILTAGAGNYGGTGIQVGFGYNSVAIGGVSLTNCPGVASSAAVFPSGVNTPTNYVWQAYTISPIQTWYSQTICTVTVRTTSSMKANTAVAVYINDIPQFYQNGNLQVYPGGLNPNTRADLGLGILNYGCGTEVTASSTTTTPGGACANSAFMPLYLRFA